MIVDEMFTVPRTSLGVRHSAVRAFPRASPPPSACADDRPGHRATTLSTRSFKRL